MIYLSYKLLEEEAIRYFEMILRGKETRVPRVMSMIWGPALAVGLIIIFKIHNSVLWWIVAVSFSLIWILFICPWIYRDSCHTAAKRMLAENKAVLHDIDIKENEGLVTVNGEVKKPRTYFVYYDLLVIGFEDNTNLVVPERVFEKDEKLMERLITDIALYIKNNAKTE